MDVAEFLALMDLEPAGADRWIARSPDNGWKRVFGGQVLAQALVAAERSVEGRAPHSLHAYFILGGDPAEPIELTVERVRDGRSFSVRRVVARQRGETMFVMSVSFQVEEEGALNHQLPMPDAPAPEATPDPVALAAAAVRTRRRRGRATSSSASARSSCARSTRAATGRRRRACSASRRQNLWIRIKGPLPDDPAIHRAALVYLSDMTLIDTVLVAHGSFDRARPVPDRQPRPCRLAAPAVPRRRLAALRAGKPERAGLARADARAALHPRRRAGGDDGAGGSGAQAPSRDPAPRFVGAYS